MTTDTKETGHRIAITALKYLGQTETKNNSGFADQGFETLMKASGWMPGESWCAYLTELIWEEVYAGDEAMHLKLKKLFSGSATKCYKNFKDDGTFIVNNVPVPGALILFQYGHSWMGHAGIVVEVPEAGDHVVTIEGNSNDNGSREGVKVCLKKRLLNQPKSNGLNILGFVHPA